MKSKIYWSKLVSALIILANLTACGGSENELATSSGQTQETGTNGKVTDPGTSPYTQYSPVPSSSEPETTSVATNPSTSATTSSDLPSAKIIGLQENDRLFKWEQNWSSKDGNVKITVSFDKALDGSLISGVVVKGGDTTLLESSNLAQKRTFSFNPAKLPNGPVDLTVHVRIASDKSLSEPLATLPVLVANFYLDEIEIWGHSKTAEDGGYTDTNYRPMLMTGLNTWNGHWFDFAQASYLTAFGPASEKITYIGKGFGTLPNKAAPNYQEMRCPNFYRVSGLKLWYDNEFEMISGIGLICRDMRNYGFKSEITPVYGKRLQSSKTMECAQGKFAMGISVSERTPSGQNKGIGGLGLFCQ